MKAESEVDGFDADVRSPTKDNESRGERRTETECDDDEHIAASILEINSCSWSFRCTD